MKIWVVLGAMALLFGLAAIADQEDIAKLIDQLGDDNQAVREAATEKLIEIGEESLPLVGKARESSDAEVRLRADTVAKIIRLKKSVRFSEEVLKWYPEIYRHLTRGEDGAISAYRVFQKLKEWKEEKKQSVYELNENDIAGLVKLMAEGGWKGMAGQEKVEVVDACGEVFLWDFGSLNDNSVTVEVRRKDPIKSTAKDIVTLLKDSDADVREGVLRAISEMDAKEYAKEVLSLLTDESAKVRGCAAIALVELGQKESVPKWSIEYIKPMLAYGDKYAPRAEAALRALGVNVDGIRQRE